MKESHFSTQHKSMYKVGYRLELLIFLWFLTAPLLHQHAVAKDDASHNQELGVEVFRIQEHLVRQQNRLHDLHETKTQAETKHQQVLNQLEEIKSQHSSMTRKVCEARANGEPGLLFRGCVFVLIQD